MNEPKIQRKFSLYFGFFMTIIYLTASVYFYFSNILQLNKPYLQLFSFILFAYGVFRGVKTYSSFKNTKRLQKESKRLTQ
jgi:hypothetical protein